MVLLGRGSACQDAYERMNVTCIAAHAWHLASVKMGSNGIHKGHVGML